MIQNKYRMELSDGQKRVIEHYDKGENVFITGAGGSGKPALIRYIYRKSRASTKQHHNKSNINLSQKTVPLVFLDCYLPYINPEI